MKHLKTWLLGIPYELAFWEASLSNRKTRNDLFAFSRLGKELKLDGFDAQKFLLSLPEPDKAEVLDVGCGMTFLPGDHINTDGGILPINIHYIDPLAGFYNDLAKKHGLNLPVVEMGMIEYLSAFFPNHKASLIIIQNALDHCENPLKGIIEAVNTLHIGGILYLNHHPNEAEYENYRGFHKYNINVEDKKLVIWNKTSKRNVNKILSGFADVSVCVCDGNPVAVITKKAEVPAEMLDKDGDIKRLGAALMEYTKEMLPMGKVIKYQMKLAYYRTAQRISKLFSWHTRQRIKKILKR